MKKLKELLKEDIDCKNGKEFDIAYAEWIEENKESFTSENIVEKICEVFSCNENNKK